MDPAQYTEGPSEHSFQNVIKKCKFLIIKKIIYFPQIVIFSNSAINISFRLKKKFKGAGGGIIEV